MSGSPDLPPDWDPESDSLEELVHRMFASDGPRPQAGSTAGTTFLESSDTGRPISPRPSPLPPVPTVVAPQAATAVARELPDRVATGAGRVHVMTSGLAGAIVLALSLAGWQVHTGAPGTAGGGQVTGPANTLATASSLSTEPEPVVDPQAGAAMAINVPPVPPAPLPAPVDIAFGARGDVEDGWRIGVSRPYRCTVLMAIPVLQQDGTRIVRVTVTLVNNTDRPQRADMWSLRAMAGDAPAEMVLWPAAGFRGVPDVDLAPDRSVRFLVAVRIPDQRTQLKISADRETATRAVLAGTL